MQKNKFSHATFAITYDRENLQVAKEVHWQLTLETSWRWKKGELNDSVII